MYTKYDLAEAYGMGVKEANLYNSSFSEYDLAEAYEMGVKEANLYNSSFLRR
jgi:hypothetical protein